MTTLKPEEVIAIADQFAVPNFPWDEDLVKLAAAIEAELRKKWFAEPVAYEVTPVGGIRCLTVSSTVAAKHNGVPLYAAPQEES